MIARDKHQLALAGGVLEEITHVEVQNRREHLETGLGSQDAGDEIEKTLFRCFAELALSLVEEHFRVSRRFLLVFDLAAQQAISRSAISARNF